MTTKQTKQGDMAVKGMLPDELLGAPQPRKPNKVAGEVVFADHQGREIKLRPTFEAALEIEDALGGLDGLRFRFAAGAMSPQMGAPTFRDYGVIIAAGVRAAGEARVDAKKAAEFAYRCGRDKLREPLSEFLRALVDGGRLREDDLKKRGILERLARRGGDGGERAARGADGYPFRRYLGIAVVDLGWTPAQFWAATVPEFWCAVDWITEKNLEVEERLDEVRAGHGRPAVDVDDLQDAVDQVRGQGQDSDAINGHHIPRGHGRVRYNPNLRVKPNPGFVAWRERLRVEHGI